jgi:hypothetical protein
MKGYILFFLLVVGSFAAADEGTVAGYVRIRDGKPGASASTDSLVKIKYVYRDERRPQFVVLIPLQVQGNAVKADAFVVNFNRFKEKGLVSKRFSNALEPGFVIDVSAKDLEMDSSHYISVVLVDANNITSLTQNGKSTAIKECIRKTKVLTVWASDIPEDNCL